MEDSKELLEGKKGQLKYDPTRRTKWLISKGIDSIQEDEEFIDYWDVYTNFLETFRNPKIDLTRYNKK